MGIKGKITRTKERLIGSKVDPGERKTDFVWENINKNINSVSIPSFKFSCLHTVLSIEREDGDGDRFLICKGIRVSCKEPSFMWFNSCHQTDAPDITSTTITQVQRVYVSFSFSLCPSVLWVRED